MEENTTVTTEVGTENKEPIVNKTYSEADFQSEVDRRLTTAQKKWEKSQQSRIAEASKLAAMNEEEKYKYQLESRDKELSEREAQLSIKENKIEALKIMGEKNIPLSLIDFIVTPDADSMMDNIKLFDKAFKNAVKAEVEVRLKGSTPKRDLPLDNKLTKEEFSKLSITKQNELYLNNKEEYMQLCK